MGLSDRDYQKQNYDRSIGGISSSDSSHRKKSPDLSRTTFDSDTGELSLDDFEPFKSPSSSSSRSVDNSFLIALVFTVFGGILFTAFAVLR